MTWLSILSGICRALGLFSYADQLWQSHKLSEARNAANKVFSMSDAAVTKQLSKYDRD